MPGPQPRVLVVGCGYVGTALAVRLAAEGCLVWGLRRNPDRLPTNVTAIQADVLVPNTLRHLPDVDRVFYLVAPEGDDDRAWRAAMVDGPRYLLGALAATGREPKRFLLASTTRVWGRSNGEWVDEDSRAEPRDPAGQRALEGEALVRESGLRATVVRIGDVYGPDRLRWLRAVLDGSPAHPDDLRTWVSPVHRDDCAGALSHLSRLREPESTYVLADREPTLRVDVLSHLARRLARSPPAIAGDARPSDPPPPSVRCMSERLVESGYAFRYGSFREGYEPILSRL